MRNLARRWL